MNKEQLKQKMTDLVRILSVSTSVLEDHVDEVQVEWHKKNTPEVDEELEDEIDDTRELIQDIVDLQERLEARYGIDIYESKTENND